MSRPVLVVVRRSTTSPHRSFSALSSQRASILFALSSLSNSRETQHFNKISRLPRVEHSPSLKLIKTSEIDTFTTPAVSPETNHASITSTTPLAQLAQIQNLWDREALNVGRAVIAEHARQSLEMQTALEALRQRERTQDEAMVAERAAWHKESRRLRNEIRVAGVWIVVSIGTATGLAMWRFWPQQIKTSGVVPLVVGSGIAAADAGAVVKSVDDVKRAVVPASDVVSLARPEVGLGLASASSESVAPVVVVDQPGWWQSLLWKRS